MKNYSIMVDVQMQNASIDLVLYSECVDYCQFDDSWTFRQWLQKNFPLLTWLQDDGDDFDYNPNTDYCQYACYCDRDNPDSYVLASFNATND